MSVASAYAASCVTTEALKPNAFMLGAVHCDVVPNGDMHICGGDGCITPQEALTLATWITDNFGEP